MAGYGIRAKTGLIEGLELRGVTGTFSGSLTVKELIGGNIIEHAFFILEKTGERKRFRYVSGENDSGEEYYSSKSVDVYGITIVIDPAPIDRYIIYDNTSFILPANQSREINITKWNYINNEGYEISVPKEVLIMSYMISTQYSIHKK